MFTFIVIAGFDPESTRYVGVPKQRVDARVKLGRTKQMLGSAVAEPMHHETVHR